MRLAVSWFLLAAATTASADQVILKGGGILSGLLVERTSEVVTIEVGVGRVSLPASRVERVVEGASPLGGYRARALGLRDDDAAGWLALGLWAQDQGLHTQAREAFQRVLLREPENPVAQQSLGNVRLGGHWVSLEESYRARGYVWFEGGWVPREERDLELRQRASRGRVEAAERARAEAEARAREAEARARAAEAGAQRAASEPPGYPLAWALAGGGCCARGIFLPRAHPPHQRPADPPRPAPAGPPSRSGWVTPRAKADPH